MTYDTGTGRVFDPDPRTKMNNTTYIDSNDADSAVPFPGVLRHPARCRTSRTPPASTA